jgi:N4-gp56 family major capsid protein
MAGQLWTANRGFMATPTLSNELRFATQPLMRFAQFCDVEIAMGKNKGDTYSWNVYGDTKQGGQVLAENARMPVTSFSETQASVVLKEFGNSIEYSGMYDNTSMHPVKTIIHKTLKNDAARTLDGVAQAQFDATILAARPTSTTAFDVATNGTYAGTASGNMTAAHVKGMVDWMMETQKIPVFDGENYVCVTTPRQIRPFLDELEAIHKYTSDGWNRIMSGEKGRYENVRFVMQTNVAVTTGTTGAGTTGTGAYFFGADTVTEVFSEPLQLRGKIPDDYGRSQGIAWYYVGNFGITHADQTDASTIRQARIVKWRAA